MILFDQAGKHRGRFSFAGLPKEGASFIRFQTMKGEKT